jgi:hypothetical protein
MKDTPAHREPSDDKSSDPLAPTDRSVITPDTEATEESASASSPSAVPEDAETKAHRMTMKEWEASQPHYPIRRVPRTVVAHMFKGSIFGPRSWIIESARKHVRLDWVRIFREAKAARDAAAAANEAEGS